MTIYKFLPKKNYTKFDNRVITIDRSILLDGSKVLYIFLASLKNGKKITHGYIMKSLGISQNTLEKYIRQLKKLDLIEMVRVAPKTYECYIGSMELSASIVRKMWSTLSEEKATDTYTLEDIERLRAKSKLLEDYDD
jgi:DNA-binding MarR family transcriptional regulator